MDSLQPPLIFQIRNTVKGPGFTIAKLLGAAKNRMAKNFGNPKRIDIIFSGIGNERCSYLSILNRPGFLVDTIRIEVAKDEDLNDTISCNVKRGKKGELWLMQMVRFNDSIGSQKIPNAPGDAGEVSVSLHIDQNLEFEIPTTNGTDTIVKLFPANELTWNQRGLFLKV